MEQRGVRGGRGGRGNRGRGGRGGRGQNWRGNSDSRSSHSRSSYQDADSRSRHSSHSVSRRGPRIQNTRIVDPKDLPINQDKESILRHMEKYSVGIIEAATGSGKSTQVPQFILERFPDCEIIVAQPQKIAANEIASRVAEELNTGIGGTVGTIFKGDIKTSPATKIFFTTTDMLLDHVLNDNFRWDFIIIDEVHERSLETDLLLAIIKMRLSENMKFKLIIMSATIQGILQSYFAESELRRNPHETVKESAEIDWGEDFDEPKPKDRNFRENSAFIKEDSRMFDVEEIYLDKIIEIVSALGRVHYMKDFESIFARDADTNPPEISQLIYILACEIILTQHAKLFRLEDQCYSFLVFLPGIIEISNMYDLLIAEIGEKIDEFEIIQIHTNVQESEFNRIFKEPEDGKRRVILSSSIAESSITLKDVRFIIDFGMNRETAYSNSKNADSFDLVWAAKAIMKQRAGRAGRVANGIVFRMMPAQFFKSMLYDHARPEIQRSSLDKIILKLKMKNIENIRDLLGSIIDHPDDIEINKTERHLVEIGALDYYKKITSLGMIYSEFPFEIKTTRICMLGVLFGCLKQAMRIGALISQERAPIKSLAGLPGNDSKKHSLTYRTRLIFDELSNSDVIMMLNAYERWYVDYGKNIRNSVFRKGQRLNYKSRVPQDEHEFCREFYFDPYIMREVLCQYCEIKQKFLEIGLDRMHLKSKPANSLVLKLCIAAAFPGNYSISNYELVDQVTRDTLMNKMGAQPKSTLLIPEIPQCIIPIDIENLIPIKKIEPPEKISIVYSNALVQFKPNVNPNTLKFIMWLGSYSRRYFNLAWIVMKRVARDNNDRIIQKSAVNITINELNKISYGQRREGSIVDINQENTPHGVVVDEVVFLCKPEYPFKLNFKDLISKVILQVDDDSVNCHAFTTDTNLASRLMLVCVEYVQRKSTSIGRQFTLTIGKNSTLMPFYPLLPHIFSLIFCSRIEYVPNAANNRYKAIKFTQFESYLNFDYGFTRDDAIFINKLRKNLAKSLGNKDFITDANNSCSFLDDLLTILKKPRVTINNELPDWRDIIGYPKQYTKHINEPETIGQIKLLDIEENSYFYYTNLQFEEIKQAKLKYLKTLDNTSIAVTCTKTELVCSICKESICGLDGIKLMPDEAPLFSITPYYGKLETVQKLNVKNEYVDLVEQYYLINSWEVCRNNHPIAWNEHDYTFLCENSPVLFRLPNNTFVALTKDLWENNFYKIKQMNEEEMKKISSVKFDLRCLVCEEEFKVTEKFYAHVRGAGHKEKAKEFLENYMND